MEQIKTRRNERRLSRGMIEEALKLVADRTVAENVSKDTAKRHAAAVRGVMPVLGGVKTRLTSPGAWASLYARSDSTSTTTSNMKFAAVIFEWAAGRSYERSPLYAGIARAIRTALAVKGG